MQVIYATGDTVETMDLADDTQFVMNEPHGFVRLIEKTPNGFHNWYFNLQNLIALGPSDAPPQTPST